MTEETIFADALLRQSPADRSAFLDEACGGDVALRHRLEELLCYHDGAAQFLQKPALEQLGSAAQPSVPEPAAGDGSTLPDVCGDVGRSIAQLLEPSRRPGGLGRLKNYEVLEVLGKGGFGTVLKAFDERLHRVVAIKILAPELAANGTARQRFLREAQAAAAVRHDHVIDIHVVDDEPIPHLVMEYIDGLTLQQKLDRGGPLPVREVLRIGMQIAEGLAAAHKQGLIHRDIKPSNILLENGVQRVKISDFGLARAVDDASLTKSGLIAGTPQYMSPEQAEAQHVDQRSDLFSLGSVLYALVTGRPPFRADTTLGVLRRVCEEMPRPVREINSAIPEWLAAIVARLHAKKPSERFQSAREVADLLAQHLAELQLGGARPTPGRAQSAEPATHTVRARETAATSAPARSRRRLLAVSLGLLLLVTGAAAVAYRVLNDAPVGGGRAVAVPPTYSPGAPRQPPTLAELAVKATAADALKLDGVSPLFLQGILPDPADKPPGLVGVLADDRYYLPPGAGSIMRMDRSADGKYLAVPKGNELIVFAVPSGRPVRTLKGPDGHMRRVAFSPDSRLLATTAWDGNARNLVRVWDIADDWKVLEREPLPPMSLDYVTFSGNSKQLIVTGNAGQPIYVADAGTGAKVESIQPGPQFFPILCRGGKHIAAADWGSQKVILWDTDTWQEYKTFERNQAGVGDPALSPDGKVLAMGGNSEVKLSSVETGETLHILKTVGHGLTFTPDSKVLLTWATAQMLASHRVTRWDVKSGQQLGQFSVTGAVDQFFPCLSSDGKDLFVTGPQTKLPYVKVIDAQTGKERPRHGHAGQVTAVAIGMGGKLLASAGADKTVRLWDLATGTLRQTLNGHDAPVFDVAFSPDGTRLASAGADHKVRIWDALTGKELHTLIGHGGPVPRVAFAPDGTTLASAGLDGATRLWDAATGKLLHVCAGSGPCGCVAFSPDGQTLAAADGAVVRFWDVATGLSMAALSGHTADILSLAFHPDGQTLASTAADADPSVRIWDLATLKEKQCLEGHAGPVASVLWRPDGAVLITYGGDGTVRLWDMTVSPPRARVVPIKHFGPFPLSIAQTPEGRYLATANADGTIYVLRTSEISGHKQE